MKVNNTSVFRRLGTQPLSSQKVCFHWRQGRHCNIYPCPYLHPPLPQQYHNTPNPNNKSKGTHLKWVRGHGNTTPSTGVVDSSPLPKVQDKVCRYWAKGKCDHGNKCTYLHQWFSSDSFSMLAQLPGHDKAVTTIALPLGSDKLYTGSKDGRVRVWDCHTGQCVDVSDLGGEIGSMMAQGPWIFAGIPNAVKVWNTQTNTGVTLSGPVGQVYALAENNGMIFAGTQDGTILAWRLSETTNCFEPAASLKGHNLAVVSLVVGAGRLYSGSVDATVRVWDLEKLECIQTLTEHTNVVMSVLCWDAYLLSCSLDKTVKVWAMTESGNLEVVYNHKEEHGVLSLCGIHDSEDDPLHLTINHFINTKKEMTTLSFNLELHSSVSPAKLFKANVLEGHKFSPLALPAIIASSAIIEGDGGVGSIRETKFTDAIPTGSVKERFEALDKDNFECKLALVEGGDIGDKLEWGTCHIKVVPTADGGSVYKIHNEVKTLSGVEPNNEKLEETKKGMTNAFKAIEAYLIANPNCL